MPQAGPSVSPNRLWENQFGGLRASPSAAFADPNSVLQKWPRTCVKRHPRRGFRPVVMTTAAKGREMNHTKINAFGVRKACGFRRHHRRSTDRDQADHRSDARKCLGGGVERSITDDHLTEELHPRPPKDGTYPAVLRCDNDPELACSAMGDRPKAGASANRSRLKMRLGRC